MSSTGTFTAAMRAGDLEQAQLLIDALPSTLPDSVLRSVADLHMLRERWKQASETLLRMKYRDGQAEMRRKLCQNLAALQVHRPEIYSVLVEAEPSDRYTIAPSKTGHPTVFVQNARGSIISMSADNDPIRGVDTAMHSMHAAYAGGKAIGLAGIGDGYLLAHLAKHPPELILGREQAVVLFEPDPHLLLACLMLHDFTGPQGPIEQQRFSWFAGPQWAAHFRETYFSDLYRLYPSLTIRTGLQAPAIEAELAGFLTEIADLDRRLDSETQAYYERMSRDDFITLLGENPPRQARVLVLTTRFSTVLQFAAADTADGFRRMGWDAHVVIEPSPSHGLNRIALRDAVNRIKPDLVFQIDHLRSEYGTLFPPNLPAICWVQDHLPNLMNAKAGASVTLRDFVLLESPRMYHEKFGYPLRQCIYLNKATRVPEVPAVVKQEGDALVFVSNCSHDPRALAEKIVARIDTSAVADLVRDLCNRMIDLYAHDQSLATMRDLDELLDSVERERNIRAGATHERDALLHAVWHPFNDTLYRQQALRWAADVADRMGLTLGLYGNGWETNPQFARHARGYATYGEQLENLTRKTPVNLHIVPFGCLHQRLLDGLVCGGFFMIRDHPANHFSADLQQFMDAALPENVDSLEQARSVLGPAEREQLDQLMKRYRRLSPSGDPIRVLRGAVHRGLTTRPPLLEEVSFDNACEFADKFARFVADASLRHEIAVQQKAFVERYFTYESNMRRVVATIRTLLQTEPESHAQAA